MTGLRRRLFVRGERVVLSVLMGAIAFVLERRLLKARKPK
jgi:hypothetical protein